MFGLYLESLGLEHKALHSSGRDLTTAAEECLHQRGDSMIRTDDQWPAVRGLR
jgi:predicted heme/steroid binding protein